MPSVCLFKSLLNLEKYWAINIKHVLSKNDYFKILLVKSQAWYWTRDTFYTNKRWSRCLILSIKNQFFVIDCEFHAIFRCSKYNDLRRSVMFNWYFNRAGAHYFYNWFYYMTTMLFTVFYFLFTFYLMQLNPKLWLLIHFAYF